MKGIVLVKQYQTVATTIFSEFLDRDIKVDFYLPQHVPDSSQMVLLIVNDGQDLAKMQFEQFLNRLYIQGEIKPILVAGLHCNKDRKLEYGTADVLDYLLRGSRARYHRKFIIKELVPYIMQTFNVPVFSEMAMAGFSLGGLSALDIAWKHPELFKTVGVFSGSLWWRSRDLYEGYDESTDRIMHNLVQQGKKATGLRFFFQCGALDETMDRNNNGIIDSIDDTLDLIKLLEEKGYRTNRDIKYLELPDGTHDVATWGRAFPEFLTWAWGVDKETME